MDQIDQTPLGGKNFGDILNNKSIPSPKSGLSRLLGNEDIQKSESVKEDSTTLEFLRLEREKNQELNQAIKSFESIQSEVQGLRSALSSVNDKIHSIGQNDNQLSVEDFIRLEKLIEQKEGAQRKLKEKYIYALSVCSLLIGLLIGGLAFSKSEPAKVETKVVEVQTPVEEVVVEEPKIFYASLKFVNMRTEADPKGQLIKTISPNQKLEFVEQKGGWLKVQHLDLITNKTIEGWVWYELVKKLK